jgi:hypothetical protein
VGQQLLLAQLGKAGMVNHCLKGLQRLIKGKKRRLTYETREQRVFEQEAKKEFQTLKQKGLRIPLL